MKTPQEKAKELVERFENHSKHTEYVDDNRYKHNSTLSLYHTKQCALICVDELLNATKTKITKFDRSTVRNIYIESNYWHTVKQEIEKL